MMAGVMLAVTSCLSSDETEVTFYDDAAVTGFYISSAEVEHHTLSSAGKDSTYIETNTDVAKITFQIDQYAGRIYNTDSLPYGTNVKKLLCAYTTKNNGMLGIRSIDKEDEWKYLAATDSIDFSVPRRVKVYAYNDRELTREYTVEVNVKKSPATAMAWTKMADVPAEPSAMRHVRLLACGNGVTLLASDGVSTSVYRYEGEATAYRFEKVSDNGAADMYANAVAYGNAMAVLNGAAVEYMRDGTSVTERHAAEGLRLLVAMGRSELYAISTDGRMMVSADHGATWTEDMLDDDAALWPDRDIAAVSVPYRYNSTVDHTILVGQRSTAADSYMQSWLKVSSGSAADKWVALTANENTANYLPRLSDVTLAGASSSMLFATGKDAEGKYSALYISRDGGLTWKEKDDYTLPAMAGTASDLTICVDGNNMLWAVRSGSGEVWACGVGD